VVNLSKMFKSVFDTLDSLGDYVSYMTDLNPEQFSAYCRQMAKKHADIAARYTEMAAFNDRFSKLEISAGPQQEKIIPLAEPTVDDLLRRLRQGHSRVGSLASDLNTDESRIEALLAEAGDRIVRGTRGWIKLVANSIPQSMKQGG
jgi:hypothetical protein